MSNHVKVIECPRDAMQGIKTFIPTEQKVQYIQSLLRVGFDTIDFGSFVSPKAIPQMVDTRDVLAQLDLSKTSSKLLAIIANSRGADDACQHPEIDYLGYPFSISENFQMRNTHKTIAQSVVTLQDILNKADAVNKEVVVYISMGFGNPYGDPWNVDVVGEWTERLSKMGVKILSLSDTVGTSNPENIDGGKAEFLVKYNENNEVKNWIIPIAGATAGVYQFTLPQVPLKEFKIRFSRKDIFKQEKTIVLIKVRIIDICNITYIGFFKFFIVIK